MAGNRDEGAGSREEFWREHVGRWGKSGQSIRGYCRTRGLSEAGFHFWKRKLRGCENLKASKRSAPAFAEVRIAAAHEASIEIVLPGTQRIQVHPGFDEETLARVLAVMERAGEPGAHKC